MIEREDIRLVDCAGCGAELLGDSEKGRLTELVQSFPIDELPPFINGRIMGRPYCKRCLRSSDHLGGGGRATARGVGEPSPWQENAVRELEDR